MRLTHVCYFRRFREKFHDKLKKLHWRHHGRKMWVRDLKLPKDVEKRLEGVEIEDTFSSKRYDDMITREIDFVDDSWTPPVDLSDFIQKKKLQEEAALAFSPASRFVCGEKQAAILSKCLVLHAPPPSQEAAATSVQLPADVGQVLQRAVMRAHLWANDEDRLPRRFIPELPIWKSKPEYGILPVNQTRYMLTDLLRYACRITWPSNPETVTTRMSVRDVPLSTHYSWRNHRIHFQSKHDLVVCGRQPLPPLDAKPSTESDTHQPLPDISPVSPLIDFVQTRDYTFDHKLGCPESFQYPHLVTVNIADLPLEWNTYADPEALYTTQDEKNAIGIMSAFSVALATARQRFGLGDSTTLPEPVVSQVVVCDAVHLDFIRFQLNTLDFSNDEGVKNFAWIDSGHALFRKRIGRRHLLRSTTYHDLNPDVFKRLLVMYRFGLQGQEASSQV